MNSGILSKIRQKRIVRGLRHRYELFAQRMKHTSSQSEIDEVQLRSAFEVEYQRLEAAQKAEKSQAITACDDQIDLAWGKMEIDTFTSLRRQENSIQSLLKKLRSDREQEVASFTKAKGELQREYDVVKHHPGKRFEAKKSELESLVRSNEAEFDRCLKLTAARSLSPSVESPDGAARLELTDMPMAYESIQQQRANIIDSYQRMKNYPPARLIESLGVWLIGMGLAIVTGGILWVLPLGTMVALGGGFGVAVLSILGTILAVRPAIKKMTQRELPIAQGAMVSTVQAATYVKKCLEQECLAEQSRLKLEFKTKSEQLEVRHQEKLASLQRELDEKTQAIRETERRLRREAAKVHVEETKGIEQRFKPKLESLLEGQRRQRSDADKQHREQRSLIKRTYREGMEHLRNRLQNAIQFSSEATNALHDQVQQVFPSWHDANRWQGPLSRGNLRAVFPLGRLSLDFHSNVARTSEEAESLAFHGSLDFLFRLIEDGSLVIEAQSMAARDVAQKVVRNLLLRAFTSLPPGGFQTTIIDPDGLGKDYAWLMHLADADPRMVNYRVWTQTTHIAEQLSKLSHHTEDVIQQLLRDRYPDLRAYNREAGTMAEAYRVIVWSRFPSGLDESSWKSLCSLLSSGGRCGVGVILLVDPSLPWPFSEESRRLEEVGLRIRIEAGEAGRSWHAQVIDNDLADFQLELEMPPEESVQRRLLDQCAEDALRGNRVEVPFDTILPTMEARGKSSSAEGLAIPLGQSGISRSLQLRLGSGTSQHVLIAGKTGSGKSSLLHTMITSAALKYAPDQLRLILLDFKKGVEFQVYAEASIPHADIIGIESQREFGVSALEHLDRIMQRRGEAFRTSGVQDVPSWIRKNPDRPMPRILVVIDEFQELFVEDDKLAQQASMLLDRIVRQGRSFGIHVVLASQTLGGSYSLPRTTLAQMAVRIALQCEGADAMIILSEDNLAAERLRHAGQAIYNDASGRIEGNQPFQVAYLSKASQLQKLQSIPSVPPTVDECTSGLGRCIVFEGHRAASWDEEAMKRAMGSISLRERTAFASIVGDSVSIEPALGIQWTRQVGRNLLIVGSEDRNAMNCMATLLTTMVGSIQERWNGPPSLFLLDGSRPDDVHAAGLPQLVRKLDSTAEVADIRSASSLIARVHANLEERVQAEHSESAQSPPPIVFVISQLGRFRELRKSEDFSFGEENSNEKPDQQFQRIVRDGPSVGIHTLVWVDNWNTVSRWLARQSLHDFELRILMQMSANDSNHLIDSPMANRLDAHVLLLHDEASGVTKKFRPYRYEESSSPPNDGPNRTE